MSSLRNACQNFKMTVNLVLKSQHSERSFYNQNFEFSSYNLDLLIQN